MMVVLRSIPSSASRWLTPSHRSPVPRRAARAGQVIAAGRIREQTAVVAKVLRSWAPDEASSTNSFGPSGLVDLPQSQDQLGEPT